MYFGRFCWHIGNFALRSTSVSSGNPRNDQRNSHQPQRTSGSERPRGTTVTVATNGEGYYQALYLVPSSYQIVVEAAGFKKSIRDSVVLQIASTV